MDSSKTRWFGALIASGLLGCTASLDFLECAEDRDCAGLSGPQVCRDNLCDVERYEDGRPIVDVIGPITETTVWEAEQVYRLEDREVFVRGELVVRAGVTVLGRKGSALIVTRDGRIRTQGTETSPVVFTSAQPRGQRSPGDWSGLAILGMAPLNTSESQTMDGTIIPEGSAVLEGTLDEVLAQYGGDDSEWNCGILEYTRIEFAGSVLGRGDELNGLTVAGCGDQTIIDHVQVHLGFDDGVEVFGGTVDLKHVLISRARDDGLDWDQGWQGSGQFVAILLDEQSDRGIEASNQEDDFNAEPRSNPNIYNVTILGTGPEGSGGTVGLYFKEGTGATVANFIVTGMHQVGLDIEDTVTATQAREGRLIVQHGLFFNNGSGGTIHFPQEGEMDKDALDEEAWFRGVSSLQFDVNPALSVMGPDWIPAPEFESGGVRPPNNDQELEAVEFLGAFDPAMPPWTDGWTAYPDN